MNNTFVFGWIALAAILIVENMVSWMPAYVFIDWGSKWWILAVASTIIWWFIWYWLRWMTDNNIKSEEDFDF